MAKKTKKRVFTKAHLAALKAAGAARKGKPRGKKRGRPAKTKLLSTNDIVNQALNMTGKENLKVGDTLRVRLPNDYLMGTKDIAAAIKETTTKNEKVIEVVNSSNDQQVKALALQVLLQSNY